jgi:hypothetical protein
MIDGTMDSYPKSQSKVARSEDRGGTSDWWVPLQEAKHYWLAIGVVAAASSNLGCSFKSIIGCES